MNNEFMTRSCRRSSSLAITVAAHEQVQFGLTVIRNTNIQSL